MAKKEVIVISLGGSVIVPDKIDIAFLKAFRRLIRNYLKKYKFIIVTGGGKTARNYIGAAGKIFRINNEDKDWLGIHCTRLNSHLLKTVFENVSYKRIIKNPNEKVNFHKILIAAGWRPGFSTDYDSVILARTFNAKTVINITNIDYLYNKNPLLYKNAKKIDKIDWKGFRKIVGNKWKPGMNVPFDPVAAKEAQKLGLRLILIGKDIKNFKKLLDRNKFKGSFVE